MNLTHKKSLVLAVAAALGIVTPLANATLITSLLDGKDDTAVKFSIEEQGENSKVYYGRSAPNAGATNSIVDQDLTVHIPVVAGYTVTQANRMIVRVTLTGGATFANKPYLICAHSAFDGTNSNNAITEWADGSLAKIVGDEPCLLSAAGGQLRDGGATNCTTAINDAAAVSAFLMSPDTGGSGSVTATFTLPEKLITRVGVVADKSGAGCILTFGRGGVASDLASGGNSTNTGVFVTAFTINARQDVGLKAEVTYVDAGSNTVKTYQGNIIKFVTALAGIVSAGVTQTIDVGKKASKEFVNGTVVEVGTFNLTGANTLPLRVSKSVEDYVVGVTNLVTAMVSGFTVTISGPTVAGAKQAWLSTGAGCAEGTKFGLAQVATTSGGSTVTLSVSGLVDPADITSVDHANLFTQNRMRVCLEVPGTTTLSDGQLTATLTGLPKSTSFVLDLGTGGNLSKIDRNGAVVRVLNIPAKTNVEQISIRFFNTSSQITQVRGTLYSMKGEIIGTENSVLVADLKPYDVEMLDAAKLETQVKATAPWSGKAWLLIQADVDKEAFKVQALVRTPGGVPTNLSSDAYN